MKRSVFVGAITSIVAAFPTAFVLALVWRYPIPFSGYESGIAASWRSLGAVVFYGVLGGFLAVGIIGALAGWAGFRILKGDEKKSKNLSILSGILVALAGNVFMAILDKVIGPW